MSMHSSESFSYRGGENQITTWLNSNKVKDSFYMCSLQKLNTEYYAHTLVLQLTGIHHYIRVLRRIEMCLLSVNSTHSSRHTPRTESCAHYHHSRHNNNCVQWQDDLMDLNGGWSPSFISKYEHEFARVLVSYCTHLCACPSNYDEPGSTPHCHVCALAAVSCLWGAVYQNVKMPWQELSYSLSAIFSLSPAPSFPVSCCTFISSSSAQYLAPNLPKHWSFDT